MNLEKRRDLTTVISPYEVNFLVFKTLIKFLILRARFLSAVSLKWNTL